MTTEFAINEETGKQYEIKQDRWQQYPHLQTLKTEAETITVGATKYWKLRCNYLEKTIDETYSVFERDTCRMLYKILSNRE